MLTEQNKCVNLYNLFENHKPFKFTKRLFLHVHIKIISLFYLQLQMTQAGLRVKGTSLLGAGGMRRLRVVRERRILEYIKSSNFSSVTDELCHLGKVTVP